MLALIGVGLLLHESVYLSSRGLGHFVDDMAPALGLHLGALARAIMHFAFVLSATIFVVRPDDTRVAIALLLSLSVLIAAFPKRVPNHLAVAWFFLLVAVLEPIEDRGHGAGSFGLGTIQLLIAATYLFAAFHKLNRSFFDPIKSCGSGLLLHYLLQRGVKLEERPAWVVPTGIYAVILLEFIAPLLLLAPPTVRLGVLIVALLALTFGFLGHAHFSCVMFAGLAAFLGQPDHVLGQPHAAVAALPLAVGLALIGGNTCGYKHRHLALLNYTTLSLVAVETVWQAFDRTPRSEEAILAFHHNATITIAVVAAYTVNAAAPYLGLKQDFSLAMFSNLRPDEWDHFLVQRPLRLLVPRYITDISFDIASERHEWVAMELKQLLPRSKDDRYAIGYVVEVIHHVQRIVGEDASICASGRDVETGWKLVVDGHGAEALRWYERLCVYPFALPGCREPLCA